MSAPIVVVGSLNMDLVMRITRLPIGGETLYGESFQCLSGGKGANQAVAAARLGARVEMIGRVGDDAFAQVLRQGLEAEGIGIAGLSVAPKMSSGMAMVLVDAQGENRIILAPGANAALNPAAIEAHAETIARASLLVVQLEIPVAVVERAIAIAHAAAVPVLLNPAPAVTNLPQSLWAKIAYFVPNESEASLLSGIPVHDPASALKAARIFHAQGAATVLITLGAAGLVLLNAQGAWHLPAQRVHVLDSTAAGDTFIGGFIAGLYEERSLHAAIALGQAASALCVQRLGAQTSIPYRHELSV